MTVDGFRYDYSDLYEKIFPPRTARPSSRRGSSRSTLLRMSLVAQNCRPTGRGGLHNLTSHASDTSPVSRPAPYWDGTDNHRSIR